MNVSIIAHFDGELFGNRVYEHRCAAQLTVRGLGKLLGVSGSAINRIEHGKHPNIEHFGQLCEWMRIDPREFFYSEYSIMDE